MVAIGMPWEPIAVIFFSTHGNPSYALENLRITRIVELVQQEAGAEAGVNHKRETPRSSRRCSTGGSTILSDSEGTTTPSTSDGARKIPPAMVVSSTQMLQHDCRTLLV